MKTLVDVTVDIERVPVDEYESLMEKVETLVREAGGEFRDGIGMEYEE